MGPRRETPGPLSLGGPQPERRSVQNVKLKENISQKIIKQTGRGGGAYLFFPGGSQM